MTRFLNLLAYIQTHLDDDLSLDALALRARMSPAHFQRIFRHEVGESPRAHVERARLERSAFQLLVRDAPVVDIAVEHGFQSHEVFTRAFRRHFGSAPSQWRAEWPKSQLAATGSRTAGMEQRLGECALSSTMIHHLRPLRVAFVRHTGPYEDVDISVWTELVAWAERHRIPCGGLLGVAHDPPVLVDARRLRFDACLVVPEDMPAPHPGSRIALADLAGGPHGVTTCIGPPSRLDDAYRAIMQRLRARKERVVGLPSVERYVTTQVLAGTLQQIEIALPVQAC